MASSRVWTAVSLADGQLIDERVNFLAFRVHSVLYLDFHFSGLRSKVKRRVKPRSEQVHFDMITHE